ARVEGRVSRPPPHPVSRASAVGGARVDRIDRLEMDPGLSLQRRELGPDPAAPGQRILAAHVARRADPRDDLGHSRAHLAHPPVRHGHPARGLDGDPEGHPGSLRRGRGRLLPNAFPDHDPHAASDHQRGAALRHRLHVHRHDRHLHPDPGRTLRHHPGPAVARVLHRDPGKRPGGRRRDLDFPAADPRSRGVADAPHGPSRRGRLMPMQRRTRRLLSTAARWGILVAFSAGLSFPFYWMLITAFKRTSDLYNLKNNPFLFHEPPTLEHLRLLFQETLFPRWLWNTALAGTCVVAIT